MNEHIYIQKFNCWFHKIIQTCKHGKKALILSPTELQDLDILFGLLSQFDCSTVILTMQNEGKKS